VPCRWGSVSAVAGTDRLADQPAAADLPTRPGRWGVVLRLAVGGVFLAAVAVVLAGQWRQARPLLGLLSLPILLAAFAMVLGGIFATFRAWRAVLADLGAVPPVTGAMRIFYLGQLGKYLPGSLWPVLAQMRLGRDYRVPPRASGAAFVVFMLLVVGTGLLVGVPVIPLLGRGAVDGYRWLALVLPLLVLAVTPQVLNRVLGLALRLARRPPLPAPLSVPGVLRVVGWLVASWACYGVQLYLLARPPGPGCARPPCSCCSARPSPPLGQRSSRSCPGCCSWSATSAGPAPLSWSAGAGALPGQAEGRVAQTVVQGNGVETSRTSATWETKRTKLRLDQWLRCPGVLPRSRT
jgi:hypothetical protein